MSAFSSETPIHSVVPVLQLRGGQASPVKPDDRCISETLSIVSVTRVHRVDLHHVEPSDSFFGGLRSMKKTTRIISLLWSCYTEKMQNQLLSYPSGGGLEIIPVVSLFGIDLLSF